MKLDNCAYLDGVLFGKHTCGFYSCIHEVRSALWRLLREGVIPERISFRHTLHRYKDRRSTDLYPILFSMDELSRDLLPEMRSLPSGRFLPTRMKYEDFPFELAGLIERAYFNPSERVLQRMDELRHQYQIDPANTLGVLHRGTDKRREVKLRGPKAWAEQIEKQDEGLRVWIQTDCVGTRTALKGMFRGKREVFHVEQLPAGRTYQSPQRNRDEWSVTFESVMRLLGQCDSLITHAGNCGITPLIYKGKIGKCVTLRHTGEFADIGKIFLA